MFGGAYAVSAVPFRPLNVAIRGRSWMSRQASGYTAMQDKKPGSAREGAGAVAEQIERLRRTDAWRLRHRRRDGGAIAPQFLNRRRYRRGTIAALEQRAEDRVGLRRRRR